MKYGMRERISGAVILLALAVIFIPMLFDDPPSREEQPAPVLTIEQPIEVERVPVNAPEPPASLGQIQMPRERGVEPSAAPRDETPPSEATPAEPPEPARRVVESPARPDPIADLARQSEQRQDSQTSQTQGNSASRDGDWAVQVGSFGKPDNAERLEADLKKQGFDAFQKARKNELTTVYVGPFASSEAGERIRAELKEKVNIQGLLVRLKGEE